MSETLTYNESESTESSGVTLNEAEQEALVVGEQMEKDQGNALLAGKYENAEQLEKAYMELQSKLGSRTPEESGEETTESEPEESEPKESESEESSEQDLSFLDQLYEEAQGEPSDEVIKRLEEMDTSQLADMYVQYRQQVEANNSSNRDFTSEESETLYNVVGGKQQYSQLVQWASQNLTQQEANMYDAVMAKGDPNAAYWAIRGLALQYLDKNGFEGKRISGKAPKSDDNAFRSQAELVQAMSDPRYESDDAYRNDVMNKLSKSNLSF
tara:strand:- start:651 stop:1460 length:810 start_codon:yes stop_codon:yes gene_type:complete